MPRLMYVALAAVLAACGTQEDERPVTLEVVTLTVLAPNCGQVQCHSSTTKTKQLAFDTVNDTRAALHELEIDTAITDGRLLDNDLMHVLLGDDDLERMPPDSALADEDITLIRTWLSAGGPGL